MPNINIKVLKVFFSYWSADSDDVADDGQDKLNNNTTKRKPKERKKREKK